MDDARAKPHALPRRAVHALFVASGAAGLVYEVLWMRRFAELFGATAPAAAATLCAFFAGLAAGSAVLGPLAHRLKRPLLGFAALEAGIGATALLVEPLLGLARAL